MPSIDISYLEILCMDICLFSPFICSVIYPYQNELMDIL